MHKRIPKFLFVFFFLSGASALMFEIVWQRLMVLIFGSSAPATTAILTAIFCGFALGSWVGGKLLRKIKRVYLFYAAIEIWICLWGISVPHLLKGADALQLIMFKSASMGSLSFFFGRFALAILAVLPATFGMGATIPVMNKILTQFRSIGPGIALAYGVNTIGSVGGCLLTGIVLIPTLGINHSLMVAGSMNLIVGFGLWIYSVAGQERVLAIASEDKISEQKTQPKLKSSLTSQLMFFYFISGFLALGYEIVWFRLMGMLTTNSMITFTVGLAVYLLGFSSGSLLLYPALSKRLSAGWIFFYSNVGAGLMTLCLIPLYYYFSDINHLRFLDQWFDAWQLTPYLRIVLEEGFFAFIIMLIPPVFMGLAYPSICALTISDVSQTPNRSGWIYSLGTFGAACGAILVGLGIVPIFDIMMSLALLCLMSFILSFATMMSIDSDFRKVKGSLSTVLIFLIIIALSYGFLAHPIIRGGGRLTKSGDHWLFKDPHPEFPNAKRSLHRYKSGGVGNVSVDQFETRKETFRRLLIDGQRVASTRFGPKVDAKMLAHVPLAIHPQPERALSVGFGSGGTSWSMTRYGIEVDCAEIEPEVVRSAHLFSDQNYNILEEPNYRVIMNDVRNYLHLTEQRYDVVSTDVTNLQYKQNGSLYTREYFQLIKDHLTSDGVAAVWMPMLWSNVYDFQILLKTFQTVFPHSSVWYFDSYYVILIGTPEPLEVDEKRLASLFRDPKIAADLKEINVTTPEQFLEFLIMDEEGVSKISEGMPIHTDDYPILEFRNIPHLYYGQMVTLKDIAPFLIDSTSIAE